MLSRLKKRSEKAAAPAQPRWHPNFRNFQRLPDIKVVRTTFFVNFVAIVAATASFLCFAYNEYRLHSLASSITEWEARTAASQTDSDAAVKLHRQFLEQEKRIDEIVAFQKAPFRPTELIVELGRLLPGSFYLSNLEVSAEKVVLRGTISDEADRASGLLSTFVTSLREDAWFKKQFPNISTTSVTREPNTGKLLFELALATPPPPKGAKK